MQTTKVITHISNWLKEYATANNSKGFVIGISGGIDSAVTSVLAAKTGMQIICIEMPIYQNKNELKRGKNHIKWLKKKFKNVTSIKMELTSIFDEFIKKTSNYKKNELGLANTRARLRMTTLYYFAQANNSLVLGTGNKVEDFGIGFFTKHGDGGVDISPIADLLKSEVYTLAKELNINDDIIDAHPTDGLWLEEKTDEDQIGANYTELEWAMHFKGNKNLLSNREKEVLQIYKKFNDINQHKMTKIPVCIIPKDLK
ncbi:MAG: NAD(+) synthase [Bacteroidota bacterium]|nr:NAD(+) synthase [Bacteroidota bacterium]